MQYSTINLNMALLTNEDIGARLSILLRMKRMTRQELADKLNEIRNIQETAFTYKQVTETTIKTFEDGRRIFSFVFVLQLCEIFNVDIRYFTDDIVELITKKPLGGSQ